MKEVIISTEAVNSYGTRVLTSGIDLSQYERNPVLLWMHRRAWNGKDMPIGRMENLRVEDGKLIGTPVFDQADDFAKQIESKWENGFLRMASAGLEPQETSPDPALVLPGQTRETVTRCKLVEVSIVDIGSNDDALQLCGADAKLLKLADAAKKPLGDGAASNKRVINQFIHPDVLKTCQLSMGMTVLEEGSVWNTMPAHTHERRMEVYMYFEVPQDQVIFHMMGQGQETRHIVMRNEQAVISPSWSIHAGAGTASYTFIWAMGGENQAFDDMDVIPTTQLR